MNIINLRSWKSLATLVTATLLFAMGWSTVFAITATPTITTSAQSTTTDPIILTGTAEANADITVTGGQSTATTTSNGSGNWSVSVDLVGNAANTLSVTASSTTGGGVSLPATVVITHDTTAPSAPTVAVSPMCSTSSPVTITGTAEANSIIRITGGTSTSTATTTGAGSWSALVSLFSNSNNTLSITATDANGNVSASTSKQVAFDTTAPVLTLNGLETIVTFNRNPFVDLGVSVSDSLDSTVTATTTGQFDYTVPGTYTLTYTATDCAGNVATTSRTVIIKAASSGGGGGGGSSNPPGITVAASVTPSASVIPGQAIGLNLLQQTLQAPGQVLGATTVKVLFTQNMRVGSRGPAVTALQTKLTEIGFYRGPITGYYGGLTRAAVVAYQKANGLPQVGQVGPRTRALLNR